MEKENWYPTTRKIPIKVVVQEIPNYVISCSKLLGAFFFVGIITLLWLTNYDKQIIVRTMEKWWRIHWLSWDPLCLQKKKLGSTMWVKIARCHGLYDIQAFNLALVTKQIWDSHAQYSFMTP